MRKPVEDIALLYVEDEPLIAMDTEMTLQDLGYRNIIMCHTYDQAEKAKDGGSFDLAILDVNLNGKLSMPIAEYLAAKGTRIVFATGYNQDEGMLNGFDAQIVRKPLEVEQLKAAIEAALGG